MKTKYEANELWLRRQAMQIAGQLPDDIDQARKVLEFMGELLDVYLAPAKTGPVSLQLVQSNKDEMQPASVVPLPKRDTT